MSNQDLTIEFCIAVAKKFYRNYPFADDIVRAEHVAKKARDMFDNPNKYWVTEEKGAEEVSPCHVEQGTDE